MNILERKELYLYDPIIKELIKHLEIEKNKIELLGSSGLKSQRYFSDYDLYSSIKKKPNINTTLNYINEILNYIEDKENLWFIELKLENKNGEKKKIHEGYISKEILEKYYKNLKLIKIDLIGLIDNKLREISIIYEFIKTKNEKEKLMEEIQSLEIEGSYYKLLKRIFSYYKLEGKKRNKELIYLSKVFNSELGRIYLETKNLEAIKLFKEHYKDENSKRIIELNLRDLGLGENEINSKIRENTKLLNMYGSKVLNELTMNRI